MDPKMMEQFSHLMRDPNMIKMAVDTMKQNPEMVNNIMKNMGGMMPTSDLPNHPDTRSQNNSSDLSINKEPNNSDGETSETNETDSRKSLQVTNFSFNQSIITYNLNNKTYNNQNGQIKSFHPEKERFLVNLIDLNQSIYVREKNLKAIPSND